jgi:uncharacterized protein YjaG (DUF416 family)
MVITMKINTEGNDRLTIEFEGTDEINFIYHLLNNEESTSLDDYKKNNNINISDIGWDIWKRLDDCINESDIEIDW